MTRVGVGAAPAGPAATASTVWSAPALATKPCTGIASLPLTVPEWSIVSVAGAAGDTAAIDTFSGGDCVPGATTPPKEHVVSAHVHPSPERESSTPSNLTSGCARVVLSPLTTKTLKVYGLPRSAEPGRSATSTRATPPLGTTVTEARARLTRPSLKRIV